MRGPQGFGAWFSLIQAEAICMQRLLTRPLIASMAVGGGRHMIECCFTLLMS